MKRSKKLSKARFAPESKSRKLVREGFYHTYKEVVMFTMLPPFVKEQLMDAGLRLVLPWMNNLEFQLLASWPQLHLGSEAKTVITQKARTAKACVTKAALALKRLLKDSDTTSLDFADALIGYSDQHYSADGYFQPLNTKDLPSGRHRFAAHRILGDKTELPLTGNLPAQAFLLELSNLHRQLSAAWQAVFGLSHQPSGGFKKHLEELASTITELRGLCLHTHEARMSGFAMTLLQLLLAVEDEPNLSWLDIPKDNIDAAKPILVKLVAKEWPHLINVVANGMREFLEYLPIVPVGSDSPHVAMAIADGKLVVHVPSKRVYFEGIEHTKKFAKSARAYNTLVVFCRAARRGHVIGVSNFTDCSWDDLRLRKHRLLEIMPELVPCVDNCRGEQTYSLSLPGNKILLIERKPGFHEG